MACCANTDVITSGTMEAASPTSIFDFTATDIDGNEVNLSAYKDHVCIIVNVASK